LRADLWSEFGDDIKLFRIHSEPIGPHPCPSFGFAFTDRILSAVTRWLERNIAGRSALIHPVIADDHAAHTAHAQWFGEPIDLSLDRLSRSPSLEGHGVRFMEPTQPDQWGVARGTGPGLAMRFRERLDVNLYAIEGSGEVVGLIVMGTHYPDGLDGDSLLETTAIHQLWIAPRYQGHGWGHRALALALDYLNDFTDSARTYMGPVPPALEAALSRRGFFQRGERWRAPAPGTFGGSTEDG